VLRYALTRLVSLGASLVVASLVIFAAIEIVPGDPAAYMLGMNASPETVAALRAELGLDAGPVERYLDWAGGMLRGDFGISYTYRTPVADMVAERLKVSLPLALYALTLSTLIAFPVGVIAAARRGTAVDAGVMGVTQLGVAVPNFWFAMLLVLVFAIKLRWVSAGGFPGWDRGIFEGMKALTLPAIALALPQASILARVMRSALIETLGEDFIRTARAKGLTRGQACAPACAPERADPGADDHRAAVLVPARGRDHHRERVLPARARAAGVPGDHGARPDRGRERGDAARLRGDRRDLRGRSRLCGGRPAAQAARLMRNLAIGGALAALFLIAAAAVSFLWTPFDVAALDIARRLQPPSGAHWFGTDHFGRDVFSMIMVGARVSIAVALVAVGIGMGAGVPLGLAAAALRGSWLDDVIMRGNDLVFAFPALVIAILITAVFGPSAFNAIMAIGHLQHPRLRAADAGGGARALAARVHPRRAGRGQGTGADLGRAHPAQSRQPADRAGHDPVLARHPRRGGALLCRARGAAADAVLGADAGREPDDDRRFAPWLALFPGFAIVLTVLGLNLMGDGLRDLLDPRLQAGADMSLLAVEDLASRSTACRS
jgi:peptide/nickel transport system permease protein